jgi:hypothetical protein
MVDRAILEARHPQLPVAENFRQLITAGIAGHFARS